MGPYHDKHTSFSQTNRQEARFARLRRRISDDRPAVEDQLGEAQKIDRPLAKHELPFVFVPFELHLYLQS
jgi:hypothetical protein